MQTLLDDRAATFDVGILRELFLQCLPSALQMLFATASDLSLSALALQADEIMEGTVLHLDVLSAMSFPERQRESSPDVFSTLEYATEVSELRREVCNIAALVGSTLALSRCSFNDQSRQSRPSPSRCSPSRSCHSSARSPSLQRNEFPSDLSQYPPLRWYHRRFGESAERCARPCSWTGNDNRQH